MFNWAICHTVTRHTRPPDGWPAHYKEITPRPGRAWPGELQTKVHEDFTITEKAFVSHLPTVGFCLLE